MAKEDKAKGGKRAANASASNGGNRRETARENRTARQSRDARNSRGTNDEISARHAVNAEGDGGSNVPELNPVKIWDRWNAAGTATAH